MMKISIMVEKGDFLTMNEKIAYLVIVSLGVQEL